MISTKGKPSFIYERKTIPPFYYYELYNNQNEILAFDEIRKARRTYHESLNLFCQSCHLERAVCGGCKVGAL